MSEVTRSVHFALRNRRKVLAKRPDEVPPGPVPRVARLLALAIKYDRLLRDGQVSSLTELAAWCRVTQPRMTQIMNLLHLAPDIQEQVLFLASDGLEHAVHEHGLREVVKFWKWDDQRKAWDRLLRSPTHEVLCSPPKQGDILSVEGDSASKTRNVT